VRAIVPAFALRVNDILRHASLYASARGGGFYTEEKLMTERALFATL
jgi:hypothetical protein